MEALRLAPPLSVFSPAETSRRPSTVSAPLSQAELSSNCARVALLVTNTLALPPTETAPTPAEPALSSAFRVSLAWIARLPARLPLLPKSVKRAPASVTFSNRMRLVAPATATPPPLALMELARMPVLLSAVMFTAPLVLTVVRVVGALAPVSVCPTQARTVLWL